MKSFRKLFELYSQGMLPNDKVEELNQQLIQIYFDSLEDLNENEMVYTEDLVFELYATNNLDKSHSEKLKEKFEKDKSLSRKYNLLNNLSDASQSEKEKRFQQAFDAETEEQEEAELKDILEEVIEKVHAENEVTSKKPEFSDYLSKLKALLKELFFPLNFSNPQVRLVMVAASTIILGVIVWVNIDTMPEEQIAINESADSIMLNEGIEQEQFANIEFEDSVENTQIAEVETPKELDEWEKRELAKREHNSELIAANYSTPKFEVNQTRNQTSLADSLFNKASERYTMEDYDSCIQILNHLLVNKLYWSTDILNEIHFFLGNSYLAKGMKDNNEDLLRKSLESLEKSDAVYFRKEVAWYSLIANLKLSREEESLKLIDKLIKYNYPENITEIRDSLYF